MAVSIAYAAAARYDSAAYDYDGNPLVVVGTVGFDALFTEKRPARLTDMPRGDVDPRGYMTGRLPDTKTFYL